MISPFAAIAFAGVSPVAKGVGIKIANAAGVAAMAYCGFRAYKEIKYKSFITMFLNDNWDEFGIFVKHKEKKMYPKYIREEQVEEFVYRSYYRLPVGMAVKDLEPFIPAIEHQLNCEVDIYSKDGFCCIEISTGHLQYELPFEAVSVQKFMKMELPIVIGVTKKGLMAVDLLEYPHLLIGGQTGGGKSVFFRQALISLMYAQHPDYLQLNLIDLKGGLEFQLFKDSPFVKTTAKNAFEALELLAAVEAEMDYRFELFYSAGVEKITEYNQVAERLPYIVLGIDEYAELCPEDVGKDERWECPDKHVATLMGLDLLDAKGKVKAKDLMTEVHSKTSRLLRLARALGIHLILATQRPDAKVLPGQSKQNIPATVAFRVRNKVNSQILLDSDSAATLPPGTPGRAILQMGSIETEVQVPYLSTKEARVHLNSIASQVQAYYDAQEVQIQEVIPEPTPAEEVLQLEPSPQVVVEPIIQQVIIKPIMVRKKPKAAKKEQGIKPYRLPEVLPKNLDNPEAKEIIQKLMEEPVAAEPPKENATLAQLTKKNKRKQKAQANG